MPDTKRGPPKSPLIEFSHYVAPSKLEESHPSSCIKSEPFLEQMQPAVGGEGMVVIAALNASIGSYDGLPEIEHNLFRVPGSHQNTYK